VSTDDSMFRLTTIELEMACGISSERDDHLWFHREDAILEHAPKLKSLANLRRK
jgi:hypothetical protein